MTDTPRAQGPSQPPRPDQITRFFDWIRGSGLNRDGDCWIAGVCGGIAARIGLDPLIVRGIAVVIAILGGPVVFAYAVGWALMPRGAGRIYAEEAIRGRFQPAMVAIGALLLFTVVPLFRGLSGNSPIGFWAFPDWLTGIFSLGWGLAVTAGIIWLIVFLVRRAQKPRPAPGSGFAPGAGAAPAGPFGPGSVYDPRPSAGTGTGTGTSTGTGTGTSTSTSTSTGTGTGTSSMPAGTTTPSSTEASASAPYAPASDQNVRSDQYLRSEQNRLWQEQNRARQAAHSARLRARRPGAGYSAIVLGLALAVGAVAAGVYSNGVWSQGAVILGVAFALGVLALGIVIAGIRGRADGAMGGFAFLAAATLVVLGVFPQGTQFTAFGSNVWSLSANSAMVNPVTSYAMIAGQSTVDLSDFDNPGLRADRTIDVWLGAGVTKLILPADAPVRVESHALVGGVDYSGRTVASENGERTGVFAVDQRTFNASSRSAGPLLRIWTLTGVVMLENPNS